MNSLRPLLQGIDTIECAYYLRHKSNVGSAAINFQELTVKREGMRTRKAKEPDVIKLGGIEFFLHSHGSSSGYPLIISNRDFHIQMGEFNDPSFFVRFSSEALWRESPIALHQKFMTWANSIGLGEYKVEGLSRVDWSFDYFLPDVDFDDENFLSMSSKDSRYREDGKAQTFCFGKGDTVLRVYNKIAEIAQQSGKVWFYDLWGCSENVWRVEWQTRKILLRRFGIRTFNDLAERQGDALRFLASEHDTLRIKSADSNKSRWPLHPLWLDIQSQIEKLDCLGVYREIDPQAALDMRLERIAISVYGYTKRAAAIYRLMDGKEFMSHDEAVRLLNHNVRLHHYRMTWRIDVDKRVDEMRLGNW